MKKARWMVAREVLEQSLTDFYEYPEEGPGYSSWSWRTGNFVSFDRWNEAGSRLVDFLDEDDKEILAFARDARTGHY